MVMCLLLEGTINDLFSNKYATLIKQRLRIDFCGFRYNFATFPKVLLYIAIRRGMYFSISLLLKSNIF